MRKLFIAGNWKMNLNISDACALATSLKDQLGDACACGPKVAVAPSFVYLPQIIEILKGTNIAVGAQDVYFEGNGAFTGEVSVEMLKDIGCDFTILGHSERRHVIGENDELTNKKVLAALNGGLDVILCVGELLEDREGQKTEAVVEEQLTKGLAGVTAEQMAKVTIAYEPVWAIGTGKTATPEMAQETHAFARKVLTKLYGNDIAQATPIQYGGSVKPGNAAELMSQPDVDGALVGGAALKAADFLGIIQSSGTC